VRPRLPRGGIRVATGGAIMVAALGLQLAMVARAIAPSILLALAGYAALFAGMITATTGALALRRGR